jgi:Zn-dependent protease
MNKIIFIIIQLAVFAVAISVHESAHAWTAYKFGDPTAKNLGRVTLNPIPHIDPIGTIIFPLMLVLMNLVGMNAPIFGWAKPVPVNPYNFRNPRRDDMIVSAAGPGSNFLLVVLGVASYLGLKSIGVVHPVSLLSFEVYETGVFPIAIAYLMMIFGVFVLINIILLVFNLIPIPPLDGSHILEGVLRGEALEYYEKIKPYGFLILLGILYFGFFEFIIQPIFSLVEKILI